MLNVHAYAVRDQSPISCAANRNGRSPLPDSLDAAKAGPLFCGGITVFNPIVQDMLEFCGRHGIAPVTEHFSMKDVNKALDHLRSGKARYRVVLDN